MIMDLAKACYLPAPEDGLMKRGNFRLSIEEAA